VIKPELLKKGFELVNRYFRIIFVIIIFVIIIFFLIVEMYFIVHIS